MERDGGGAWPRRRQGGCAADAGKGATAAGLPNPSSSQQRRLTTLAFTPTSTPTASRSASVQPELGHARPVEPDVPRAPLGRRSTDANGPGAQVMCGPSGAAGRTAAPEVASLRSGCVRSKGCGRVRFALPTRYHSSTATSKITSTSARALYYSKTRKTTAQTKETSRRLTAALAFARVCIGAACAHLRAPFHTAVPARHNRTFRNSFHYPNTT